MKVFLTFILPVFNIRQGCSLPGAPRLGGYPTELSEFMSAKESVWVLPLA